MGWVTCLRSHSNKNEIRLFTNPSSLAYMHLTTKLSLCDHQDACYRQWEEKHTKPVGRVSVSRDQCGLSLAPGQVRRFYVYVLTGLVLRRMEGGHVSGSGQAHQEALCHHWPEMTRPTQRSSLLFPWPHFGEWHHHPLDSQSRMLLLSTSSPTSIQSPSPGKRVFSIIADLVKNLPAVQETWARFLGRKDPLEKDMATHSSILAWRIPWTEEPGRLQSMRSQGSDMP